MLIVVIPVCTKDHALVLKNLAWLKKFGQKPVFKAVLSCEIGIPGANEVSDRLPALFNYDSRDSVYYDRWEGDQKWPTPQNYAWQQTARRMEALGCPWLWWEADAVPLSKTWLETLWSRYESGKRPFLGAVVEDNTKYMAGVGIYPPAVRQFSTNALICRAAPFDVVLGQSLNFSEMVTDASDLIQHRATTAAPTFRTRADIDNQVRPSSVLFHPCKDGSLIDRLSGKEASAPGANILPLRCRLDDFTGYGQVSTELVLHLLEIEKSSGFKLELFPEAMEYKFSDVPPPIKKRLEESPKENFNRWELVLYTLVVAGTRVKPGLETLFFTMWESSRVPEASVAMLNQATHVLVPNHWFASCLNAHGVNRPIHIVPLGIELDDYPAKPLPGAKEPFTIGTAGRFEMGGIRKGVGLVLDAFQLAFGNRKDVRLKVKCAGEDQIKPSKDKRVEITRKHLTPEQMSDWYASLHVYASGSACEGWGRHQQEAMATGRPVIGVNFGGITEFWNPTNGYAVDYDLVEGEGVYKGNGIYARPGIESMAAQMKAAENRATLETKGKLSRYSAVQFPSSNMAEKLVRLLKGLRYL